MKQIAQWLWCTEWIPLGPLAPYVLGMMFGSMPQRVVKEE